MIDETKSLEHLENDIWTDEDFPTELVEKCYRYRKIPIKDLSVEQLRLLIGQNFGLPYLIPKAIDYLEKNILSEGNLYPGDLLESVLSSNKHFWENNIDIKRKIKTLIQEGQTIIENQDEPKYFRKLIRKIEEFLSN